MGLDDSRAARRPSRIVIADDHPLFRSAIRQALEEQPNLEMIGEAANGQEAIELCRRLGPELVLMDLRMPQMDGLEATRAIKKEFPDTVVLILTALEEPTDLSDSLKAGATGFVLKQAPAPQIIDAIRRALIGEFPLNEELARRLLMRLIDEGEQGEGSVPSTPPLVRSPKKRKETNLPGLLTPRELEVLRLLVLGQTNQEIARNLLISTSTVKRHIRHISIKLGACDRVQAAVRAVELGLLDERNRD
jgi:DNA-binding NarL/FixJ family response regulator